MPRPSTYATRRLLLDAEYGKANVESYALTSIYGRCEPLLTMVAFAFIAIVGATTLCEATRGTSTPPRA